MAWDLEAVRRAWEGYETPLESGECPPVMVDYFAAGRTGADTEPDILPLVRRIPTPGDRLVNLGHEFEWLRTVRVGERLGGRT